MFASPWTKITLQNTDTTGSNCETLSENSELHVRKQQGYKEFPNNFWVTGIVGENSFKKGSHMLKMGISARFVSVIFGFTG